MQKKSPIKTYILLWITMGVYGIIWIYSSMRQLNNLTAQSSFNAKKRMRNLILPLCTSLLCLAIMFSLYSSGANMSSLEILSFIGIIASWIWIYMILRIVIDISKAIEKIEREKNLTDLIDTKKTAILFIVYFIAFPYMQKHLNYIYDQMNVTTKIS